MRLLDREIVDSRALVVDPNSTSRSILVAQLRDLGVGTVVQCGRIADARSQLETKAFDVVLCEQDFGDADGSGQQLLDDLRRHQLLPLSTVFIMITGEASYTKVSDAAESALDGYLIKPHTAAALAERLGQARQRKKALREVFKAVEAQRIADAVGLCLRQFRSREPYWLYCGRIGAELLLGQGRATEARALFEAIASARDLPWARLGIARALIGAGETGAATAALDSLIAGHPGYADALDVLAGLHLEQGRFDEALAICRQAVALTPGSVGRLQKLGQLAFHLDEPGEAARALDRAAILGVGSKMFDAQALVLLGLLRSQQGDGKGLQRCADQLALIASRSAPGVRLQRLDAVMRVLLLMHSRRFDEAAQAMRELARQTHDESFDLEAAGNLLQLGARLAACGVPLEGADDWVDAIGLRHDTSRATLDLLLRSAAAHPPFAERLRDCHARLAAISEAAMAHSLAGDHGATVRALLEAGRETLNGKLVDTARLVLQRHADRIAAAAALNAEAQALARRYGATATKRVLGDASGRKAGGLALTASVETRVEQPA